MMLKFSILQIFKIQRQTFLLEYKDVWYTTTNAVTCENAKSSSKPLSMSWSKQTFNKNRFN